MTSIGSSVETDVAGYVLAGGASSRFGSDKALVRFGTRSLLLRITDLLKSCTSPVVLVGPAGKYDDCNVPTVDDRWPGEGPLGGIITALQYTSNTRPHAEWNLILSCDMPFLTRAWLEFMVARTCTAKAEVILPYSEHGPEPLCACYRTNIAASLEGVFKSGVRKLTAALQHLSTEVLDESVWKRFDSAGKLFWNMNTAADFAEAQRIWETEQRE